MAGPSGRRARLHPRRDDVPFLRGHPHSYRPERSRSPGRPGPGRPGGRRPVVPGGPFSRAAAPAGGAPAFEIRPSSGGDGAQRPGGLRRLEGTCGPSGTRCLTGSGGSWRPAGTSPPAAAAAWTCPFPTATRLCGIRRSSWSGWRASGPWPAGPSRPHHRGFLLVPAVFAGAFLLPGLWPGSRPPQSGLSV